jgi:hypothetical protein
VDGDPGFEVGKKRLKLDLPVGEAPASAEAGGAAAGTGAAAAIATANSLLRSRVLNEYRNFAKGGGG